MGNKGSNCDGGGMMEILRSEQGWKIVEKNKEKLDKIEKKLNEIAKSIK